MSNRTCRRRPRWVPGLLTFALLLLLVLIWLPVPAQAGPELPPRTPPPANQPDDDSDGKEDDAPPGAYIELQIQTAPPPGVWAVVQWQDEAGRWHDVEGWRSLLAENGHQRWWVAPKDFGKDPFRWRVFQGQEGPVLATSLTFTLPGRSGQVIEVEVSLDKR